eukprot:11932901-Karenia_brevis.AAC.1
MLVIGEKSSQTDLAHINMYFPPVTSPKSCKLTTKICDQLDQILAKLPSRTCPVVYMDATSSFGLEETPHGLVTIPSGAVGGFNLGVENHNGKQIRAVLERHFMVLMHTTRELPKSYTSCAHHTASMLDHIALPKWVAQGGSCMSTFVWRSSARKLQLTKHKMLLDHCPGGVK